MNYLFKNEVVDYEFTNSSKEKTILFLHGWGGNKNSFLSLEKLLLADFNIIKITMPTTEKTTSVWNMFDYRNLILNLLKSYSIKRVIIVCHSFGFRVATLLKNFVKIEKIVVTGGAGIKTKNVLKKINLNNKMILLKNSKFSFVKEAFQKGDYSSLSDNNKLSFKNIVNLNLLPISKFDCPMLLFWGKKDCSTKISIAKKLKKINNAKLIVTKSDHFAYLKENVLFCHETQKFLKNS